MRRLHLLAFAAILTLGSCAGDGSETSDAASEDATKELPSALQRSAVQADLSEYYIDASITVPDETKGVLSIEMDDFGQVRVQVGSVYNLVIAELIDGDLNSKIEEIKAQDMYNNEIVEQGDDFVLYKSVIEGSFVDPEFHFYSIKTIGDITYEFHDYDEEGGYAESIARYMMESVNHIEVNNSAS